MSDHIIIRTCLVGIAMSFLLFLIFRNKQPSSLNWAMFYSSLWVLITLPFINWLCIKQGFWTFPQEEDLQVFMPYDFLFVWVVAWGTVMPYVFRGKKLILATIMLFWIDLIVMPYLEKFELINLGEFWLIGELLLIMGVFVPAHLWAKFSLKQTHVRIRSLFQFVSMAIILCIDIPFATQKYFPIDWTFEVEHNSFLLQLAFIILLPSIIAVIDLSEKGRGTPFPYDPTKKLVRTGVYAYIRNPIQWSLTLFFIPLAIYYGSPYLLIGLIVSVAYTIGISNPQEFKSMEERFGSEWVNYKENVPAWYFLWKPINNPQGTIYFKRTCSSCTSIRKWFENRTTNNLVFKHAEDFLGEELKQVRYVDHRGEGSSSVTAIAHALGHINLVWATLGWFMRLPGIHYVLQTIVDSMEFTDSTGCEYKTERKH